MIQAKPLILGAIITIMLTGCASPTPITVVNTVVVTQLVPAATLAPQPTFTLQPTYTPYPTYTPAAPIIITATPIPATATPAFTATATRPPAPTSTPKPTSPPTATPNKLTQPKGDGFYLVNVDIAPGVWRSQGTGTNCYWKRSTKTDEIISNHYGQAGGTVFIAASDFQIQFRGCGMWVYLGQ